MYCKVNTGEKIVYNIAKKKVVAATKIADDDYKTMLNSINNNYTSVDLYLWNLTDDDYIVALDRSTNKLFNAYQDADFSALFVIKNNHLHMILNSFIQINTNKNELRIIIYFKQQWTVGYGVRKSASDKVPITFLLAFPQNCFKVLLTDVAPTANDATVGVVVCTTKTNFLWNSYFPYDNDTSNVSYHDSFYYFAIGK